MAEEVETGGLQSLGDAPQITGRLTNELILTYLNRLGDLLFVLARYEDRELPIERATGDRS